MNAELEIVTEEVRELTEEEIRDQEARSQAFLNAVLQAAKPRKFSLARKPRFCFPSERCR